MVKKFRRLAEAPRTYAESRGKQGTWRILFRPKAPKMAPRPPSENLVFA